MNEFCLKNKDLEKKHSIKNEVKFSSKYLHLCNQFLINF